jgi:hypothetical protein
MRQRVAFAVGIAAVFAAACGRQVTPNPPGLGPGGTPTGYMSVFFTVYSTFNFGLYQYMVVFNTTGSGVTPSTQTIQTNWAGYSYAIVARGNGIETYAQAVKFQPSNNPHIPPATYPLGTTPQTFSYNMNANGSGSEFSILAQRRIFSSTPGPSPTPSSNVWTFNAFTTQLNTQAQWTFYDSMGAGGPTPPEFVSPQLNMDTCFDNTYYALDQNISDPSAEIVTIEIANNPSSAPCSPS